MKLFCLTCLTRGMGFTVFKSFSKGKKKESGVSCGSIIIYNILFLFYFIYKNTKSFFTDDIIIFLFLLPPFSLKNMRLQPQIGTEMFSSSSFTAALPRLQWKPYSLSNILWKNFYKLSNFQNINITQKPFSS